MLYKVIIVLSGLGFLAYKLIRNSLKSHGNRFDSFAPDREDSRVRWFVDGQDYMSAVADAIEAAKKEILITDWQMNPYIFLKRPDSGVDSLDWRLDRMLLRKADEGVRVYILLYWETKIALDLGSDHTQSLLTEHPNIVVYRHPNYSTMIKNPRTMLRWSHHEKLVIVDRSIAFVGGIDLCFGRWDTHNHELMDNYPVHPHARPNCPNKNSKNRKARIRGRYSRWVGKDYKNSFYSGKDGTNWDEPYSDYEYVDRNQIPRMPWHDVACAFIGAAVLDAVQHFIQRYNTCRKCWDSGDLPNELDEPGYSVPQSTSFTKAKVQVLRSVDDWSAGQPHEASIYNAYLETIMNAKHYIYIENQFFISSQPGYFRKVKNEIQSALVDRICRAYEDSEDFHVMIVLPLKPEFGPEDWTDEKSCLTGISYWNYATLFSEKSSLFHKLKERVPPSFIKSYVSVYGLRTHGSLGENLATEIIYVHSKLMIVDDRVTIIGSANINDRSMLGERDSEVAVIIEDEEKIEGTMNDRSWQVGKFSHKLRCHLYREHLGLLNAENKVPKLDVSDPLKSSFVTDISRQARKNTKIYKLVFRSMILPTNEVKNYEDLKKWKEKKGLVYSDPRQARRELQQVRGHIVEFPDKFLSGELRPTNLDYLSMQTRHDE
jgi:phospholipase D1/2